MYLWCKSELFDVQSVQEMVKFRLQLQDKRDKMVQKYGINLTEVELISVNSQHNSVKKLFQEDDKQVD